MKKDGFVERVLTVDPITGSDRFFVSRFPNITVTPAEAKKAPRLFRSQSAFFCEQVDESETVTREGQEIKGAFTRSIQA